MNGADLLRIVDVMHREKNIPKDVIFGGIEAAVQLAMEKQYGEEEGIVVSIDRESGDIKAQRGEVMMDPTILGSIAAQSAKQLIIQKIREIESGVLFTNVLEQKGELVTGTVQRFEGGTATVSLGRTEAILPRSEQIPGETHHVGERVKAVILDVRKVGHRVKIVLSRCHPDFVRRLFEQEIPEIEDRTIEIKAIAREAGYRTKIAVSSIDLKVDCVGACVGVRGSRIKNIVDELGGERIDIVRWNDALQVLIPNSLQPANIEEVFLYPRLGRAIVLVKEDQLSLAIGRRGQNVRLASKLVGWDIEIMTHEEYNEELEKAVTWFAELPYVSEEMVEAFIEEGFLSFDDLTFVEPAEMAELTGLTVEQAEEMMAYAEEAAERVEEEAKLAKAEAKPAPAAPAKPSEPTAATLFGPADEASGEPAAPTIESLFGPDEPARPEEETPTPAEALGEETPPPPEQEAQPETEETQQPAGSAESET